MRDARYFFFGCFSWRGLPPQSPVIAIGVSRSTFCP